MLSPPLDFPPLHSLPYSAFLSIISSISYRFILLYPLNTSILLRLMLTPRPITLQAEPFPTSSFCSSSILYPFSRSNSTIAYHFIHIKIHLHAPASLSCWHHIFRLPQSLFPALSLLSFNFPSVFPQFYIALFLYP